MKILLTGGAGYIGSHTAVALLEQGYDISIVDNFYNSCPKAIERIGQITAKTIDFHEADVSDAAVMTDVLSSVKPDVIIHFAGYKAVGESVEKPVEYYRNNIDSTLTLLEAMKKTGVKRIVFSSSATVYGEDNVPPFTEDMPKGACTNPYGWTKWMQEQMLTDAAAADHELSVVLLRYFNPVGAHESGLIGEDPQGIPNNLMPYISQVAVGRRERLTVFGNDYNTPDGTCRRDYIHVMDLAEGHVRAMEYAMTHQGTEIINLGTGVPYSVLDMVSAFGEACGKPIEYVIGDRRAGDVQDSWADANKAEKLLGWKALRDIKKMCEDAWKWQVNNPEGYK